MRYLGIEPHKPRVAVFDLTSCEGCELQLANKEESLGDFLRLIDIVQFREVSSDKGPDYEVALVEGCVSRNDEVQRLQAIRAQAKVLVALGTCACFGGVHRQKNAYDLDAANREIYGAHPKPTLPVRSLAQVVEVDLMLPGCPVNKAELERVVQKLVWGMDVELTRHPVCIECKRRFTVCAFDRGELCLGPITRGGCDAPCPAGGLSCWGCRGPADEANLDEFIIATGERDFSEAQVRERMDFFAAFEESL